MKTRESSGTERINDEERWYILDIAAAFMPSLTDKLISFVFRVSATLDEPIHLKELTQAMANLAARFPYFQVELRHGFFWYYLQALTDRLPEPVADSKYPCLNMHVRRKGRFLYRVRPFRSRIAVEFCHVLSDGHGALTYLKALITEYLSLRGLDVSRVEGILQPGQDIDPEEMEDALKRYGTQKLPPPDSARKAFHFPSMRLRPGQYRIITGAIPLARAKATAKEYGCTISEFFVAVYLDCLQEMFYDLPRPIQRTMHPVLSIEVPVNMRRLFPSKTMRNFTLYVLSTLDTRLGIYEFEEITKRVHFTMQAELDKKNISRQIARNAAGGKNLLVRMLPLVLKGMVARFVFKHMGENTISGLFSNLGPVDLPEPVASRVRRFDSLPAPSRRFRTNANAISWKDTLYISFGSLATTTKLERLFFSRLTKMGISVSIESNM
ncbi:MAG: hypothetical protein RBT62_05870 [Spirochaetia bacterium]|jgi:NRPS condensation-like uncharacterized protein|nr:hypothetical protein [Spirochaetia bacterium]